MFRRLPVVVFLVINIATCRVLPPVNPASNESSVLVVSIKVIPIIAIGTSTLKKFYFARVGNDISQPGTIREGWVNNDKAFLFNAEPGDYIPVGVEMGSSGSQTGGLIGIAQSSTHPTIFFDREIFEGCKMTTIPGKIIAGCRLELQVTSIAGASADTLTIQYANMISRGGAGIQRVGWQRKSFNNDDATKSAIVEECRTVFKSTQWMYLFN